MRLRLPRPRGLMRGLAVLSVLACGLHGCAAGSSPFRPAAARPQAGDAVRIWTQRIHLPTHAVRPDPVPRLELTDGRNFYPYPAQSDIAAAAAPQMWTVICMENRYLKVMVMPELGGRVWAVYDKAAGADALFRQDTIKAGHYAIRGAWTCGGIEFNFPDGHSVSTHDEVHWTTRTSPDGSASVIIGDIERISRMGWSVEIRLCPDRAVLEDDIRLLNRTPLRQRFFYYSNASVEAAPATQVLFPFPQIQAMGIRGLVDWPVRDGVDYSWMRNHTDATSTFGVGGAEAFIGAYDHDSDRGIVHYAERTDLPGRRFWTWGNSPEGRYNATRLSQDGRAYMEIQASPLVSSAESAWLEPYGRRTWRECWIPVSRIGPIARANPEAAVRLTVEGDHVTVGVLATREQPAASVELRAGRQVLRTWRATLAPDRPFVQTVDLPGGNAESLRLFVRDGADHVLIDHEHGRYARGQSAEAGAVRPRRGAALTLAVAASRAEQLWLDARYARSVQQIEAALERWPDDPAIARLAAELRLRQGRAQDAVDLLAGTPAATSPALADSDSVQAAYLLALAELHLGHAEDAADRLAAVQEAAGEADDQALQRCARILRARCLLVAGRFDGALELLRPILRTEPDDIYVAALALHAGRRAHHVEAGLQIVRQHLAWSGLELFARLEVRLATGRPDETLARMLQRDPEAAVELACAYVQLGDLPTAAAILTDEHGPIVHNAMTELLAAWCLEQMGQAHEAAALRRRAESMPIDFVMPSRPEELAAIEAALRADPRAARAAYYGGLVLLRWFRADEAISRFEAAIAARDDNAYARRMAGLAMIRTDRDAGQAASHLERAIELAPQEPSFHVDLARVYEDMDRPQDVIAVLERAVRHAPPSEAVVEQLVEACLEQGRYRQAADALSAHRFGEGRDGRRLAASHRMAWLGSGLEALLADRLEDAKAAFDTALGPPAAHAPEALPEADATTLFWRAVALRLLDRDAEAAAALAAAAAAAAAGPADESVENGWYAEVLHLAHQALALRATGRADDFGARLAVLADVGEADAQDRRSEWAEWVLAYRDYRVAWARLVAAMGAASPAVIPTSAGPVEASPYTAATAPAEGDPPSIQSAMEAVEAAGRNPRVPPEWSRLGELAVRALGRYQAVIAAEAGPSTHGHVAGEGPTE